MMRPWFPVLLGCSLACSTTPAATPQSASSPPRTGILFEGHQSYSPRALAAALRTFSVRIDRPIRVTDADDAAFFLREFYREQGFREAVVKYRFDSREGIAILDIEEGTAALLGKLTFSGNTEFAGERLRDVARLSLRQSSRRLLGRLRYVEAAQWSASESLRELYWRAGFLSANVEFQPSNGTLPGTMDVHYQISEGPRFRVRNVGITGMPEPFAARKKLDELAAQLQGQTWTPERGLTLRSSVLRLLRDEGFYDAEVSAGVVADEETGDVRLSIAVVPGEAFTFGKISVGGEKKTDPGAILSRLGLRMGDRFNAAKLQKGERRLWFSGAFSDVRATIERTENNALDVRIDVEEGKGRQVRGVVGYSQWQQIFIQANYTDRNFLGTLNRLSLDLAYSQLGYGALLQFSDPWIFRTETTGVVAGFYERVELPAYSANYAGGILGIERQFDEPNLTGYRLRYVWKSVFNTDIYGDNPGEIADGLDYTVAAIGGGQTLDRRNDVLSPMSGYLLKYNATCASRVLGGTLDSFKLEAQATYFLPLFEIRPERPFVPFLMFNHRAGFNLPYGKTKALPVPERFFLGGPNSVRSFQLDGMPPRDSDGDPTGGELFWLFNLEAQIPVVAPFYVVLFSDAGNLSPTTSEYDWEDTRVALGVGARLYTPIGAVSVDYGYNLIQRDGDPIGAVQFGFGFNF